MRLSIVVTTYNRKDLVVEAIDSVLPWQRGPVDIEMASASASIRRTCGVESLMGDLLAYSDISLAAEPSNKDPGVKRS